MFLSMGKEVDSIPIDELEVLNADASGENPSVLR